MGNRIGSQDRRTGQSPVGSVSVSISAIMLRGFVFANMTYEVSIIGAGTMGHGLALHFAAHDLDVTLVGRRAENLEHARAQIHATVETLNELSVISETPEEILEAIEYTVDIREGVSSADLVLESISEDLDAKREVFVAAGESAPEDAPLASNTSGLQIGEIASGVPDHADRIIGCHWWNPPYLMPLVEIVRGEETVAETVDRIEKFVESVDRDPILVNRDVPGIVWNRIQFAVLRECMHLLEENVASLPDINKAVRDGYALRTATVGPFETVDLSGVDLFQAIAAELYPELCDADAPSRIFDERLAQGRNGVESGAGFFEYEETPSERIRRRDERLAALRGALGGNGRWDARKRRRSQIE